MAAATRDVVFDLGGVLVNWSPRNLYETYLGSESSVVDTFLADICTPQWHATIDRGRSFSMATGELLDRYPERAEWIVSYATHWEKMFAGVNGEVVEVLYELRAAGLRLHALSNYPGEKLAFLYREFPFMSCFETVVISGLLKLSKPDPAIYRYLLGRLDSRSCVFVDDRIENVSAARRCGITSIQYTGPECLDELRLFARAT